MDLADLAMDLVDLTTLEPTRPPPLKPGARTGDHQNEDAKSTIGEEERNPHHHCHHHYLKPQASWLWR